MDISIEEREGRTWTIKGSEVEPFTQKKFWELCQESFLSGVPHVIGRTEAKETKGMTYYDGRQLSKFLFELVISKEGRRVRMKNTLNPVDDRKIKEVLFFEVHPSNPGVGVLIGTQKDFLDSSKFRSKIFNRNDPFDALSINFVFKDSGPLKIKKGMVIPLVITFTVLFILLTGCTISVLRNTKLTRLPEDTHE